MFKTRRQCLVVPAEALDDARARLRHDADRAPEATSKTKIVDDDESNGLGAHELNSVP